MIEWFAAGYAAIGTGLATLAGYITKDRNPLTYIILILFWPALAGVILFLMNISKTSE